MRMPTVKYIRQAATLFFVVLFLASPASGQYPEFVELFDRSWLERSHLSEKFQFDYTLSKTVTGVLRVSRNGDYRERADVLRSTEEVGRWIQDSAGELRRFHFVRKIVSAEEFADSEIERVNDSEIGLHALIAKEKSWLATGSSTYRKAQQVESQAVPRCFADFPIVMLPFIELFTITSHGEQNEILTNLWANADVVSDKLDEDGRRVLLVLFHNRITAAQVILRRPDHWDAESIEYFGSFGTRKIGLHESNVEEKIRKEWKSYVTVSVDWHDIEVEGERRPVPHRLIIDARHSSGEHSTTLEARFGNWKFGEDISDTSFQLADFGKSGEVGIDFLKIRNDVTAELGKHAVLDK